jgi:hypothetical protein
MELLHYTPSMTNITRPPLESLGDFQERKYL